MEVTIFVLYSSLISLVLLLASAYYLFFSPKNSSKLPPGSTGWPFLGENIAFALSGPQKFINERMKNYSPDVFRTSLMGEKLALFCGSSGNKFLFSNENKVLTAWWPRTIRKALLFPDYVDAPLDEVAGLGRSLHHEVLKPEALKQYIPVMDSMAREHIESEWETRSELKIFPMSKKYTFALACRVFMTIEDQERVKSMDHMFSEVVEGLFALPIYLPGTAHYRAARGGKMIREEVVKIVRERRKEMMENKEKMENREEGMDFLTKMLISRRGCDESATEKEIFNNIIGLLVAGYDTTSIALTFALKYMADLPHIYDRVYKEQMEIKKAKKPGELLNWEDVQKMEYSWNVAREALRLAPPIVGSFREAITDFTYAGFTIPKGWKTFWATYSTHKNPKYFTDPETFDPTRFEGKGPAPYTFVPFGGGPRMCPGKEYARLEILVFMHNVVTKFKLEKLIPNEKIIHNAATVPAKGVPVRLHPHKN